MYQKKVRKHQGAHDFIIVSKAAGTEDWANKFLFYMGWAAQRDRWYTLFTSQKALWGAFKVAVKMKNIKDKVLHTLNPSQVGLCI